MDVLQAAVGGAGRAHLQPLLHAAVPGLGQIAHRQLARQQFLLQLIAQQDVQRIGQLIGIDADQAALHVRSAAGRDSPAPTPDR